MEKNFLFDNKVYKEASQNYIKEMNMQILKGLKGVSAVIATVLMLVITIALAGTAYLYFTTTLSGTTQGITAIDNYCDGGGNVTITVKNIGTNPINSITCTRLSATTQSPCTPVTPQQGFAIITAAAPILPGNVTVVSSIDSCPGTGARYCNYRLTPSAGRVEPVSVSCT